MTTTTDPAEHADDCLFCQAGETEPHAYESNRGNPHMQPTVADYVEQHGITLTVTSELGLRTETFPGAPAWDNYTFRVTLRRPGARAWSHIMWHQGTGIGSDPAKIKVADVFDSMLQDGAYAEYTTDSFEDWADELGYDWDSYAARLIYAKCRRAWQRMCEFLGSEHEAIRVYTKYDRQ